MAIWVEYGFAFQSAEIEFIAQAVPGSFKRITLQVDDVQVSIDGFNSGLLGTPTIYDKSGKSPLLTQRSGKEVNEKILVDIVSQWLQDYVPFGINGKPIDERLAKFFKRTL